MIEAGRTPLARVLAHESAYWSCVAQVEQRDGYKLFHNPAFPARIDPNHAGEFRATPGQDVRDIAEEIIAFYRQRGLTPAAYVDALAPADLVQSLDAAGFRPWEGEVVDLMLYVGPDQERPAATYVQEIDTDRQRCEWASIMETVDDAHERKLLHEYYYTQVGDPRMRGFVARIEGQAVARCQLFACDGLARVEAVHTLVGYRGRGLAAAVIRHAVGAALYAGYDLIYIYAVPGSDAQRHYQRLGFRVVLADASRSYLYEG